MSGWMLIGVGVLYALAAWQSYGDGKVGIAIAFACYAISNYGMYLAMRGV